MNPARQLFRYSLLTLFAQTLVYAQGIIVTPLVIKAVGVTVYGGYSLCLTVIGFLFGLSSAGIGFRSRRYLPSTEDRATRRHLLYPQLLLHLGLASTLGLIVWWVFPLYGQRTFEGQVHVSALLVGLLIVAQALFSQSLDYFRYTGRLRAFNLGEVVHPYLGVAAIASLVVFGRQITVNSLLLVHLVTLVATALPFLAAIARELGIARPRFSRAELRTDVALGGPVLLSLMASSLLSMTDRYVIVGTLGLSAVGTYAPGYALGSSIMFVAMVSGVVLLPLLSREVDRGDATVAKDLVNLYWGGFLAIGLPFVVGCVLLSRPLLSLLANDEVAVAAAWVVPLVGASALFYGGSVILGNLLVVHLRTPEMLKANVAAAICNVSLNLLLIMWWRDITAAAVAALAGYAAGFLWTWRACHSTAGFRLQAPFLGASLGATAVMGAAIVVVLHAAPHLETSFGGAAALVLGGMVVYGAAFVALAVPGLASVRRHFQAAALRVAP